MRVVTTPPYYPGWKVAQEYRSWWYRREKLGSCRVTRCPLWVPHSPSGWKRILHLLSFALSSLPPMLAYTRWKPDWVMVVAPALLSAPNALLAARLSGAQSWLHIQDFELEAAQGLGILRPDSGAVRVACWFERQFIGRFDRVSTISSRMLDRLRELGVPEERLHLLPNWVDTEVVRPSPSNRAQFGLPDQAIVALYAGNMGKKQGLDLLVRTAQVLSGENSEVIMVLAGEGPERERAEALANGVLNLRFLPLQPPERLNELLNSADIHLLPQRAEASDLVMPSKLLGMMASGKPSIIAALRQTELGEMAQHAGVRVPPGDAQAMAQAILKLARHPEVRRRMGIRARDYVVEHRSREAVLGAFAEQLVGTGATTEFLGSSDRPAPPQI